MARPWGGNEFSAQANNEFDRQYNSKIRLSPRAGRALAEMMTRLQFTDHTQLLDSARDTALNLLKSRTTLTATDLDSFKLLDHPIIKDATFAKEKGIVQEIGFPKFPEGTPFDY